MTKKQNQTKEENLVNKLTNLEDRREPEHSDTARGFVYRNLELIQKAKEKSYRWEDLARMFSEGGYKIKGSTLAYYYREARKIKEVKEKEAEEKKKKEAEKRKREQTKKKEEERRNVMG